MSEFVPKLYASSDHPDNYRFIKVVAAASLSDFKLDLDKNALDSSFKVTEAFLKKFPFGKIPVMEIDEGILLEQSDSLCFYVASDSMLMRNKSKYEQALVYQYMAYASQDLNPSMVTLSYPSLGYALPDKAKTPIAKELFLKNLRILNDRLSKKTYLVGERISLADISVMSELILPLKYVFTLKEMEKFPHVVRWFTTVINHPKMPVQLKDYKFCEKTVGFNKEAYDKFHPAEKTNKPSPKIQVPAKVEPKKEAPKKKVDIFANLAPSKFVMDEWKRMYSNNDIRKVSIPWLYENLDREGYSLWFCEYKYDHELTKPFMACNLIKGTFSSAEPLIKNLFGSFLLLGVENNLKIKGVWLQRGQELIFSLDHGCTFDPDIFNFRKLSLDNQADKKIIEDYLSWEGDFDGLAVNDGKVFK